MNRNRWAKHKKRDGKLTASGRQAVLADARLMDELDAWELPDDEEDQEEESNGEGESDDQEESDDAAETNHDGETD